jgi:hypothetical protein
MKKRRQATVACNLKKWLHYQEQKRKAAVMAMKKASKEICFLFLLLWRFIIAPIYKPSKHSPFAENKKPEH